MKKWGARHPPPPPPHTHGPLGCYGIGDTNKFKARIDCNILDVEGVANFVESYTKRTNETLRKLSPTYPIEKNEYSVCLYYRCKHKTGHQPSMNP